MNQNSQNNSQNILDNNKKTNPEKPNNPANSMLTQQLLSIESFPFEQLSNEQIVSLIKRLSIILRDRTAKEIAEIRRKKSLVDKKLAEMRTRLYKARAEANQQLSQFLIKIASDPQFSGIVRVDKSGAVRIPSSVIKELGGLTETEEVKRYQRIVNALLSASERYSQQLKSLGYGTVNIHEDHIYIRLPQKSQKDSQSATIERLKQLYLSFSEQQKHQ